MSKHKLTLPKQRQEAPLNEAGMDTRSQRLVSDLPQRVLEDPQHWRYWIGTR